MDLRGTLEEPVSEYMSTDFARVAAGDTVVSAARAMQTAGTTEAVVVRGGTPLGIVTERDILYKVVAAGSNPSSVTIGDIMSSPVAMIEESSKVGDAIAKMSELGVRRLGVTRKGKLVGVVTQKAMATGRVQGNVPLPELSSPHGIACPYCGEMAESREDLSRHIDRVHLGHRLLEGELGKW